LEQEVRKKRKAIRKSKRVIFSGLFRII